MNNINILYTTRMWISVFVENILRELREHLVQIIIASGLIKKKETKISIIILISNMFIYVL